MPGPIRAWDGRDARGQDDWRRRRKSVWSASGEDGTRLLKFLIDECLSVALARMAVATGHADSAHVAHRGLTGWPDHRLMKLILDEDWTLVTRNSDDFRPRPGSASQAPCYLGQPLHAGLICLNLPAGSGRTEQEAYFKAALGQIGVPGDLVNKVLEIDPGPQGGAKVIARLYDFPEHPD